jgi:hypothetical protein
MRYLLALLCFIPLFACAAPVTIEWSWPTEYCNNDLLPIADISSAEIYISDVTIPREPASCTGATDVPPPSAIIATVSTPDTTLMVDLPCGKPYFFVMRVQAQGSWSNFSVEATHDLVCGRPNIPIIIRIT